MDGAYQIKSFTVSYIKYNIPINIGPIIRDIAIQNKICIIALTRSVFLTFPYETLHFLFCSVQPTDVFVSAVTILS
jgi:hypothetical protein